MKKKKIVLAYSGGLDTTYCACRYGADAELELYTITVNTGGFSDEELQQIEAKALKSGAINHISVDATVPLYDECLRYLVYGNVLKNQTYPLSVSAERAIQAKKVAEYALEISADVIAHGSTGAGNDQVRFDMIFTATHPNAEIWTPVRDEELSREQEIAYLKEKGIDIDAKKAQYSINQGIWGTSVGGVETLNSNGYLPESAWPTQLSKNEPEELRLSFKKGELISVNGTKYAHPVDAIKAVQKIAGPFAIGRDIHVGDTIIGIKGRVGFEAAAPVLIIKAHHLLEKHTLTKWQLSWKDQISAFYGNWLHEGQLLDPVMRDMEAFLTNTQQSVTGTVFLRLYPYRYELLGIESDYDLMSSDFGKYGETNSGWTGNDVRGFTKIAGNQTGIWKQVQLKAAIKGQDNG
jgi:argininosuccinate synthase